MWSSWREECMHFWGKQIIDSAAKVTIFEIPIWVANELLLDWHLFPLQV